MTQSNQDQAVREWMESLGFKPLYGIGRDGEELYAYSKVGLPIVEADQALFFYTICQKAERKFAAKELNRVYLGEEGGGASHVYTTDDAGNEVEIDERIIQLVPTQDKTK